MLKTVKTLPARARRAQMRGVTMIEALLFLGIAALVIIGGLSLYNNASNANRVNQFNTQLQTYINGVSTLYQAQSSYGTADMEAALIAASKVPTNAVAGDDALSNPWGGATTIAGNGATYEIAFEGVPQDACISILLAGILNESAIEEVTTNNGGDFDINNLPDPASATAACADNTTITFTAR